MEQNRVPGTQYTYAVPSLNGKRKTFVEATAGTKDYDEIGNTQKRSKQAQQGEFFRVQGGENQRPYLEQLVKQRSVKQVAKDVLDINLNFGPAASLKMKSHINLNHRQLAGIRRMGVKMSGFQDLRGEEEKLFFEYEMVKTELECFKVKSIDEYKGPGRVQNGVVLEEKTFVRAKSLKEVISKMMEQKTYTEPSNVPHHHSAPDPEIEEKVRLYQQMLLHVFELEQVGKQLGEGDSGKTGLTKLIKERKEEVKRLHKELKEYESKSGELFVMLIGDYGGGSFKLLLSNICSMEPNSPSSGFLIAEMPGKESFNNLKEVVGIYHDQIKEIQDQSVSFNVNGEVVEKVVRVFVGGDYQFLAMMYGHGGANSTDFCLFCDCTQFKRSSAPKDGKMWGGDGWRTLQDLMRQTNCEPIFPIPPTRVVPIPLHIVLGLTKEYLTLYRDELKRLDLEDPGSNSENFNASLKENEEAELEWMIHSSELKEVKGELEVIREGKKVCILMKEKLALVDGKCCVEMKGGARCSNQGKPDYHRFCGHHKQRADAIFQKTIGAAISGAGIDADTVKEGLRQINTAEKKLALIQSVKKEEEGLNELERQALLKVESLEEDVKRAEALSKKAKEDIAKSKGIESPASSASSKRRSRPKLNPSMAS